MSGDGVMSSGNVFLGDRFLDQRRESLLPFIRCQFLRGNRLACLYHRIGGSEGLLRAVR